MAEASRTESDYVEVVLRTLSYIQRNLDEELTPRKLAAEACFSQHHFHRIFRAIVGESVMDHIRRLRLERAAHALRNGTESIGGIAFDAGYGAQEAFTRVFQAYFGMTPKAYRASFATHLLPAACGVHFAPEGFSPLRSVVEPELLSMDALCPAHRDFCAEFEERWEEMLSVVVGFADHIYPRSMRRLFDWRGPTLEKNMLDTTIDIDKEIETLEEEIEAAKQRLAEARRRRPREEVKDYVLLNTDGSQVRLSELFGDKEDLILIHNMGTGCVYCTMWADGFTGLVPHLASRAAFVLSSPDKPEVQKRFAEKRNWNFRMVSTHDTPFTKEMGFWKEDSGYWPGVSSFKKDPDGKIYRIAKTDFGPNDDFCAAFPLFDMLEKGVNGWEAQYDY